MSKAIRKPRPSIPKFVKEYMPKKKTADIKEVIL